LKKIMTGTGVFGPIWEGPFVISQKLLDGTFKLKTTDGAIIPRAWNSDHLQCYYN